MSYHITAAKKINVCKCGNVCNAKYGRFENETDANEALSVLNGDEEADFWKTAPLSSDVDSSKEVKSLSYFNEDDEFVRSRDVELQSEKNAALFEQLENIISWRIVNFYENDKRRSPRSLRREPPLLRIESSNGAEAEFVLTQKLTHSLHRGLDDVRRAYYNVDEKHGPASQEDIQRSLRTIFTRPGLRTLILIVLTLIVLAALIFF